MLKILRRAGSSAENTSKRYGLGPGGHLVPDCGARYNPLRWERRSTCARSSRGVGRPRCGHVCAHQATGESRLHQGDLAATLRPRRECVARRFLVWRQVRA